MPAWRLAFLVVSDRVLPQAPRPPLDGVKA